MPASRTIHATDDAPLTTPHADAVQPQHPSQWWYWSGHLRGDSGRSFGFQLAFFAAEAARGLLWGQMAHWAVVQLDTGRFTRGSRVWLGPPRRVAGRFALTTPDGAASAHGGDGRDRLRLDLGELALDLGARGSEDVRHYDGQRHDYSFGGHTYYYSRPCMRAVGELRVGPTRERVTGDVWFDRQYGDLSAALIEGWQWICAHLEGDEQLMVFAFNRALDERFAVHVGADGRARWLGPDQLRLDPLARWHSPRSGVDYPCAWRLRTDRHDLVLRTPVPAQEMHDAAWLGPVYWEGACAVSGSHRGVAYAELLGSLAPALARIVRPHAAPRPWRRLLTRAVQHPTTTLALATAVGHLARVLPPLRPGFPDAPVAPLRPRAAEAPRRAAS